MTGSDMIKGMIILVSGMLFFAMGAMVLKTIWWVGVCFIVTALGLLGFGVFVCALSNEPVPLSRGL